MEYGPLWKLWFPGTDVILMCSSLDSQQSLENIKEIYLPKVKDICPNVLIVLVCLKTDLRNSEHLGLTEQGKCLAQEINAIAYVECSAKTNEGTKEVAEVAVKAALQFERKNSKESNKKCALL